MSSVKIALQTVADAVATNWNIANSLTTGVKIADMVEKDSGLATGWGLNIIAPGEARILGGVNSVGSGDAAWVTPAVVSYQSISLGTTNTQAQYRITGLNDLNIYDIEVYGSWTVGAGAGDKTLEASTDNTTFSSLDTMENTTQTIKLLGVSPTAGNIDIYMRRGASAVSFVPMSAILFSDAVVSNSDPVLDTPQTDVTIQTGATGTIDAGANFSDANVGDTLTYSISPAMSAGFSFNTATGVITYDGTQVIAAAKSYTVICDDGQGGSPATDTFNITVVTAAFVIDSISSATPEAGGTLTVNYSNAAGTFTASTTAGALNKVSDAGGVAVFDVPIPPAFGDLTLNYLTALDITFSDGTDTAVESIIIQVPAAQRFAQVATIDADGIYANDTGLTVGMYAHAKDITGDMVIDLATGLVTYNPTLNNSFNYAIYDGTEWGAYAAVNYTKEVIVPVITLIGASSIVWIQGVPWVDPGATVTDNVDATRTITAANTPNVNVVGTYTLYYDTQDVAGNDAVTVTRTVTVSSADSTPNQFYFVDVNNAELNTLYENTQQILGVDAGQTLTVSNGLLSNDGGVTWTTSVQMVTGQTFVKASITTGDTNSDPLSVSPSVNGITDTFNVTTKAAVTLSYTTPGADALISQSTGSVLTTVVPIVEAWTAAPENGGTVVDSWVNVSVTNGIANFSGSAVSAATDYVLIFRTAGNVPTGYYRTMGQFA